MKRGRVHWIWGIFPSPLGLRPSYTDRRFLSKIIYTTIKIITPEELEWYTEDYLALKKEFPNLIAGWCYYPISTARMSVELNSLHW